ncbi:MAG: type II toxin-antitoxin system VapC family toxin [Candidatus Jordarchaeales archaeon]
MKMRVYLDTSVISALFDERNPERKRLTEAFIRKRGDFEVYVSEISIAEVERTPEIKLRNKMRRAISELLVVPVTDDVERLASEYIRYGAVPEDYPEDAYHIAIAVINDMDFLLSWNFRHIVRRKTRDIVRMVNTLMGVRQIDIMTPAELL